MSESNGGDLRPVEPITVYSKPSCVQCTATYRALDSEGLQYAVVDLSEHPEALTMVKDLGYLTAPVVVSGEEHWGGFRPDKVKGLAVAAQAAHTAALDDFLARVDQLAEQGWIDQDAKEQLQSAELRSVTPSQFATAVEERMDVALMSGPGRDYLASAASTVAKGTPALSWNECAERAQAPEAILVGSPDPPPTFAVHRDMHPTF